MKHETRNMNNRIQKGFGLVHIIAIIAVLIIGGVYISQKGSMTDVAAPTITLISPNGGETLTIGQPTTVTFKTEGEIKDDYQVVIWLEEGAAPLATIAATTTTYTFIVPESVLIGGDAVAPLEPGSYKIRVALYDGVPCTGFCLPTDVKELASDSSDGEITIKKVFTQPFVPAGQTSSMDWKTYTDTRLGYSLKYPATWKIDSNTGGLDTAVDIYNPLRNGKPDTDQPREHVFIDAVNNSTNPCKESTWEVGFGGIYYATKCVSSGSEMIKIQQSAFDETAKTLVSNIVATFTITN